jgi:large repetitive protein
LSGEFWTSTTTPLPDPLAAGSSPLPLVVTATLASGAPAAVYQMSNVGVVAYDRLTNTIDHRMKASFAQFLSLRHGGSGYVFGFGGGAVGQNVAVATSPANPHAPAAPGPIPADRPFHSLSYPDINYTIMRPAALPPSAFTDPQMPTTPPTPAWPPTGYTGGYIGDPGVRNPSLYQGFATNLSATPMGSTPASNPATQLLVPPAIPARRLFQPPDAIPASGGAASNAGETGDAYINNTTPATAPVTTGALPPFLVPPTAGGTTYNVNDSVVNLFWVPSGTAPQPPAPVSPAPATPNPYLGAHMNLAGTGSSSSTFTPGAASVIDQTQHPYFRTEMLQKAMNLTTVRTHQYAVWITIGFFEVKRQGDLQMAGAGAGTAAATLAFDILGPEIGASTGQTTRYRGFFLVDRLQLTAYDPNVVGSFRPAVVYRQTIE